jgi:DNA-binding GntR family transcriptional regulator
MKFRIRGKIMQGTDAEKAYQLILDKIIKAEMDPGSLIQERLLMDDLGFGRTPIREALKRLEVEHFVNVSPRRGMFVAPIDIIDINQITAVRLELETLGIRLAVEKATPDKIKVLDELADEVILDNLGSQYEMMDLDRNFHFQTYAMSHNKFLEADLKRYYFMSQRIWYYGLGTLKPIDIGINDHIDIVSAIKEKDTERAEEAIRRHISNFQKNIKLQLI